MIPATLFAARDGASLHVAAQVLATFARAITNAEGNGYCRDMA